MRAGKAQLLSEINTGYYRQVKFLAISAVATRYSEGMALITDMLDAANARLDAGQQLVNARINIIYYYYKLLFISGTI